MKKGTKKNTIKSNKKKQIIIKNDKIQKKVFKYTVTDLKNELKEITPKIYNVYIYLYENKIKIPKYVNSEIYKKIFAGYRYEDKFKPYFFLNKDSLTSNMKLLRKFDECFFSNYDPPDCFKEIKGFSINCNSRDINIMKVLYLNGYIKPSRLIGNISLYVLMSLENDNPLLLCYYIGKFDKIQENVKFNMKEKILKMFEDYQKNYESKYKDVKIDSSDYYTFINLDHLYDIIGIDVIKYINVTAKYVEIKFLKKNTDFYHKYLQKLFEHDSKYIYNQFHYLKNFDNNGNYSDYFCDQNNYFTYDQFYRLLVDIVKHNNEWKNIFINCFMRDIKEHSYYIKDFNEGRMLEDYTKNNKNYYDHYHDSYKYILLLKPFEQKHLQLAIKYSHSFMYYLFDNVTPDYKCLQLACKYLNTPEVHHISLQKLIPDITCANIALKNENFEVSKYLYSVWNVKPDINSIECYLQTDYIFINDISMEDIGYNYDQQIYDICVKVDNFPFNLKLFKNIKKSNMAEFTDIIRIRQLKAISKYGLKHKLNPNQSCFEKACASQYYDVYDYFVSRITNTNSTYTIKEICEYNKFLKDKPVLYKIDTRIISILINCSRHGTVSKITKYLYEQLHPNDKFTDEDKEDEDEDEDSDDSDDSDYSNDSDGIEYK
jgi:hypothetical protein